MKHIIYLSGFVSASYLWDTQSFGCRDLSWIKVYTDPTDELEFVLNSQGGEITEGLAVYDTIKALPNPKNLRIVGQCASIATVIACAFDTVEIAPHAQFLIHDAWGQVQGDLSKMQSTLDMCQKLKSQIIGIYSARSGKPDADFESMMSKDTWLTAEEWTALGFPGTIAGENPEPMTLANYATAKIGYFPMLNAAADPSTEDPEEEESKEEIEEQTPKVYSEEELNQALADHADAVLSAYKDKIKADAKLEEARQADIKALTAEIPGQDDLVNAILADTSISAAQAKIMLKAAHVTALRSSAPAPSAPTGDQGIKSHKEIFATLKGHEAAEYFKTHRTAILSN